MSLLLDLATSNSNHLYPYIETILIAKKQDELYFLQNKTIDDRNRKNEMSSNHQATSETWAAFQIWLHHKCLEHLFFGLLKFLFLHLFTKESIESCKCNRPVAESVFRFCKSIKKIKSDNGIEYVNLEFSKFFTDQAIIHELTCVNTPQQNGISSILSNVCSKCLLRSCPNCHLSYKQVSHVVCLDVLHLSILIVLIVVSWTQELSSVSLLVTLQIKIDINVITFRVVGSLYQWMLPFMKHNFSLSILNFRSRSE
ncbi:hypothetical protein CR513_42098, partial [Mucuna pruriens]